MTDRKVDEKQENNFSCKQAKFTLLKVHLLGTHSCFFNEEFLLSGIRVNNKRQLNYSVC
jgi:hypothetical protein